MADIGNLLQGAEPEEALDRFINALDDASIKMGSNAALEARVARQQHAHEVKMKKLDKEHAKLMGQTNKGLKLFNKSLGEFSKDAWKGLTKLGKAGLKAGAIGGLLAASKVLVDVLLKSDAAMAKLSGRLSMTRKEMVGIQKAATSAQGVLASVGVTIAEASAEAGNLVLAFQTMPKNLDKLIVTSTKLQKVYGLASGEAAKLLESLERAGVESDKWVTNIGTRAKKEGLVAGLVMKDLSSNSEKMAVMSERNRESMAQMAIEAAKAGTSLDAFSGMKGALGDFEGVSKNLSALGLQFGKGMTDALGTTREVWLLNQQGEEGRLEYQRRFAKGLKASTKVLANGDVMMLKTNSLMLEMHRDTITAAGGSEKFMEMNLRLLKANTKEKKDALNAEIEEMEIMKNRQDIMSRFTNMMSGFYDSFIIGIAESFDDKGDMSKGLDKMGDKLEKIFNLKHWARDIRDSGFIEAIKSRLGTLFDWAADQIGEKLGLSGTAIKALTSMGLAMAVGMKAYSMINKLRGSSRKLPMYVTMVGGMGIPGRQPGGRPAPGGLSGAPRRVPDAGNMSGRGSGGGGFFGNLFKGAKSSGKSLLNFGKRAGIIGTVLSTGLLAYEAWQAFKTGDWLGLIPAALSVVGGIAGGAAGGAVGTAILPGVGSIGLGIAGATGGSMLMEGFGNMLIGRGARGLAGYSGPALIGEAGGEVHISRSALRSGIGVGGRAASALAGIGVPGFYRGEEIGQTAARTGLSGDAGSQSILAAQATAFMAEQKIQQAAMIDHWQKVYDTQMQEAGKAAGEDRKKQGKSWQTQVKGFFNAYPALIDKTMQDAFNIQDGASAEIYKGIFTAMSAWSSGDSVKDALKEGVKAGLAISLGPDGELGKLLDRYAGPGAGILGAGADALRKGKSFKKTGKAMLGAGIQSAGQRLFGSGYDRAAQYRSGTGAFGATLAGAEEAAATQGYGSGDIPPITLKMDGPVMAGGGGGNFAGESAAGRFVNRPTLTTVGEGGRSEIIIPTDRIRKGLPINPRVASELGSIGVPGFSNGGVIAQNPMTAADAVASVKSEGFGGNAQMAAANAAFTFGSALMAGEGIRGAGVQALSAGIGAGATAALMLVPPPGLGAVIGPLLGPMIGQMAGPAIGKLTGMIGGQKKGRKNSLKKLEQHVRSGGLFDFGQPGGLKKQMRIAIGGKENAPTEGHYNKLLDSIGGSQTLKPLWAAGVDPSVLIALTQGGLRGKGAFDAYAAINTALYGSAAGDKYMSAMQVGPQLGVGGIVTRPTRALIGEKGPEAVIPLTEQRKKDADMLAEMKTQNKLMGEMIKAQKESGQTEIRLDGRKISETVGQNFYDIGTGMA